MGLCLKVGSLQPVTQKKGEEPTKEMAPETVIMAFFTSAVSGLKIVVTAIGAGVGVWGVINLLEGYGNDNPGAKSQGIKHFMPNLMEV